MNRDEKRGYTKGYNAGRRRQADERRRANLHNLRAIAREEFVQKMMLASAPHILGHPWIRTVKGEKVKDSSAGDFARTIRVFAQECAAKCDFETVAQGMLLSEDPQGAEAVGEQPGSAQQNAPKETD